MKKENCNIKLNWDYKGWEKTNQNNYNPWTQDDWNKTLLTMINQASAQIHMTTLRAPADSIKINVKTFYLVTRLEYFNEFTFKLGDKYNVIVDDNLLDNEIFVYNKQYLEKEVSLIPQSKRGEVTINSDGYIETELLDINYKTDFTSEDINEYKRNLCVHISILNRNPTM